MKMEHVTIHTEHLDDSVKFYQENLGLSIQADFRESGGAKIVFLADSEGDTRIELIENLSASYNGSGISIGYHCGDVIKVHEDAQLKGLNPTPLISPNPHVTFFFVKDPNGVSIQFI